jgi:hypothetical protein
LIVHTNTSLCFSKELFTYIHAKYPKRLQTLKEKTGPKAGFLKLRLFFRIVLVVQEDGHGHIVDILRSGFKELTQPDGLELASQRKEALVHPENALAWTSVTLSEITTVTRAVQFEKAFFSMQRMPSGMVTEVIVVFPANAFAAIRSTVIPLIVEGMVMVEDDPV